MFSFIPNFKPKDESPFQPKTDKELLSDLQSMLDETEKEGLISLRTLLNDPALTPLLSPKERTLVCYGILHGYNLHEPKAD